MSTPIEALLHVDNFLRTIEEVKNGIPGDILPARMFKPTDKTIGNTGSYYKVTGTRQTAQQVAYGAPSKSMVGKGVTKQPVTLLHAFENFPHDPLLVQLLKSLKSDGTQKRGVEIVGKKIAEFTTRFQNLRKAAWYSALAIGHIYFDADGNLLPTSAGAVLDIDFAIPAANQNQLDWDGNGAIIGASWATAGTDIIGDLRELKRAAISTSGYQLTKAYYGANIPGYFASNTALLEYMSRNQSGNASVLKGEVPDGLMGLEWIDAQNAFYEDANGTNRFFWGPDTVVFTPSEANIGWWGFIEGSYSVPSDIGQLYGDALSALNSLREVFGTFGYAKVSHDPVGITQYGGDTFLPVISVPAAIYIADVTP
jgi:hypothetical protein|tara:strand:- start:944 stop:2047 length:1104 start_codon:yes stop_codon:yes gene_type:complete